MTATPTPQPEPFIYSAEVARRLGVSRDAIKRAVRRGTLPVHRVPALAGSGTRPAFRWSEIEALIESVPVEVSA